MRASSVVGGLVAAGAAALAYGLHEARQYRLRAVTIPALAQGADSLRVLHLSDMHLAPQDRDRINWVRELQRLEPDLIVVTGDFIAHPDAVPLVEDALGSLFARPGAFVFGSNDYYGPTAKNPFAYLREDFGGLKFGTPLPTEDLRTLLVSQGWQDLNNQQGHLQVNGTRIHLRGTDDPHIQRDDYSKVAGAFDSGAVALGVTHAPYRRILDSFVRDGAHVILAGHTHGGQVCLPFYGALTTNCDLDRKRAKGLSTYDSAWLHVSAGLGTSPITPVRVACPPEASLLVLTSAQ